MVIDVYVIDVVNGNQYMGHMDRSPQLNRVNANSNTLVIPGVQRVSHFIFKYNLHFHFVWLLIK